MDHENIQFDNCLASGIQYELSGSFTQSMWQCLKASLSISLNLEPDSNATSERDLDPKTLFSNELDITWNSKKC
jgi:hypothetical protein